MCRFTEPKGLDRISYSNHDLFKIQNRHKRIELDLDLKTKIYDLQIHRKTKRGKKSGIRSKRQKIKTIITNRFSQQSKITGIEAKNLVQIKIDNEHSNNYQFPNILCANVRSIANKMDEILTEITDSDVQIAILTEMWLSEDIPSDPFSIDGYVLIRNDRFKKRGGGVCIYVKEDISFKQWPQLETEKESLWITIRPKRMPRNTPCLTIVGYTILPTPIIGNWESI